MAAEPFCNEDDEDEFRPIDFDIDEEDALNEPDELDLEISDFVADNDIDDVDDGKEDRFGVAAIDDELNDVLELN